MAIENHTWRFSRTGGVDQARIESGDDILALETLDQKLWVALSCPTNGLEFDTRTLELIDSDKDGHIRVPEIIAAIRWIALVLKDINIVVGSPSGISLSQVRDDTDEGRIVLSAARKALTLIAKPEATDISIEDIQSAEDIFAHSEFNGNGIVSRLAAQREDVALVIDDIINCVGGEPDSAEGVGVSASKVEEFFSALSAYDNWWAESDQNPDILPYGQDTIDMSMALNAVRVKIDDFFTRCALTSFDGGAAASLNPAAEDYLSLSGKNVSALSVEVGVFPIARITLGGTLPLIDGINPAWVSAVSGFRDKVVVKVIGECERLDSSQWEAIKLKFAAFDGWFSRKAGGSVASLGIQRVREILMSDYRTRIEELIAQDKVYEDDAFGLAQLDRLIRYCRDLFTLLNNFVSFRDFFSGKAKSIFQAGTLFLDGRSFKLCIKVDDANRHAALATLGRLCLVYCSCTRDGGAERMTIAATVTAGDSDHLVIGRNGIFYDRQGRDWDATVVRIIEHPISMRQAFWAPYKRIGKLVGEQVQKMAANRSKNIETEAAASMMSTGQKAIAQTSSAATAPPQPPPAFDVGKFAGIFAAIGLAIGAIGTALAAVVTGLFKLSWWQLPIAIAGILLLVSGPSVLMAWFKLAHRNLAPLLDANGWAVNSRVRINLPFGMTLTSTAKLPAGAERSLFDPFAEKKRPFLPYLLVLLAIAVIAAIVYFKFIR